MEKETSSPREGMNEQLWFGSHTRMGGQTRGEQPATSAILVQQRKCLGIRPMDWGLPSLLSHKYKYIYDTPTLYPWNTKAAQQWWVFAVRRRALYRAGTRKSVGLKADIGPPSLICSIESTGSNSHFNKLKPNPNTLAKIPTKAYVKPPHSG